jgi:hypothetical protein
MQAQIQGTVTGRASVTATATATAAATVEAGLFTALRLGNTTINRLFLGSQEILKAYLGNTLVFSRAGVAFDADAQAFFDASGITDATQKNAVNQLVVDLKAASLWAKIKALYPMVGGTASTHKWNLKDPRDLDAAFRLVFNGGVTHSASGFAPNGTNGYAETYFNPSTEASVSRSNFCLGYYGVTNESATGARAQMGVYGTNASNAIFMRFNTTTALYRVMVSGDRISGANGNTSTGFISISTIALNTQKLYKNGSVLDTNTATTPALIQNATVHIGRTNGGSIFYANTTHALSFISEGLSDAEMISLNTAVQAFQTTLSRNV